MKAPDAFRTISEVAHELDLPQHVLRFWETRFSQIKPMKRGGGRRYYRPEDVDMLRGIRLLLYGEGFTIRGVQRLLKEKGVGFVAAVGQTGSVQTVTATERDSAAARQQARQRDAPTAAAEQSVQTRGGGGEEAGHRRLPPLPARQPAFALTLDARRRMESALEDLLEAKRLLDQAR